MPESNSNNGWLSRAKATAKQVLLGAEEILDVHEPDLGYGGYDGVTVSMLLGSGKKQARSRVQIYQKYHFMSGDPILAGALRLHVTAALGGHETTGEVVFIEAKPEVKDSALASTVDELKADLSHIFNRIAASVSFNACAFGDAYGRAYTKDKIGLVDVLTDEMVHPPLVQPYERANKTIGYTVCTGNKFNIRLTTKQLARMKMPRMVYVPQVRVLEKAVRSSLENDDIDELPLLPSLVGGSFFDAAEESYDNLLCALSGVVGQRLLSSIDENIIAANFQGMTMQQRKEFKESLVGMLKASKERSERAITENRPVTERLYHIMPTFNEKQLTNIVQFQGTSGSQSFSVEDVLFHAKMLAGALGTDLSMLGFADILSGGLGEGGFYRTSAQAAERARIIRTSLTDFFNQLIDIHTLAKYGWVFEEKDRPYTINFWGTISALENERAATKERAMQSAAMLVQTLDQMKNIGLPKETVTVLLTKHMAMDESEAKEIASGLDKAKPPEGGDGGGGFGEPGGGEPPPQDFDQPQKGTPADNEE